MSKEIIKIDQEIKPIQGCKPTRISLEIPEDTTFEQWLKIGEALKSIYRANKWWVGDWINFGEHKYGEMYSQALDETDYKYETLKDYKYTASRIEKSCRHDNLSFSHHKAVAPLEPKEQEKWLEKAEKNKWTRQQLRDEIKKSQPPPKLEAIKVEYNVIVIDPPWAYGTEYNEESRRVASPYPEQPTEKLKEFKLNPAKDAVIWLWTTHQFIQDAFQLLKEWGFEYKLTMVWDKQKLGMGEWLRCQAEFCLLGVRGDYHKHWNLTNERDIISTPRREHSRKPEEFYKMVKKLCPGKRIDIFSREKHEGFEQYGNETNKF